MIDLGTDYLGMQLKNPLVASSSPLGERLDQLKRIEDHGAAAVVLHSLFEEQFTLESYNLDTALSRGAESSPEAMHYFPELTGYRMGPDQYLEHIRAAKEHLSIPVIASLNGSTPGGWHRFAKEIEQAGADALELNIYNLPTDPEVSSAMIEQNYAELAHDLKVGLRIPIAVKIGPFFTAPVSMARRFEEGGIDGLVMFNRFYQPDFDLERLEIVPVVNLSASQELLLRLRWVAIMYGRVKLDLAITGGVHTANDVLKSVMAGAKVAMMTSALLRHGVHHLGTILEDLRLWMERHEYTSIRQMQGSMSQQAVRNPQAFERANYIKTLSSYILDASPR
jgi:dihydroorotate dehydrogenase (fumarate)